MYECRPESYPRNSVAILAQAAASLHGLAAMQQPVSDDRLSGRRRAGFSVDAEFYSFEEFLEHCQKEQYMIYDEEAKEHTVRSGALHLWSMGYDEEDEKKVADHNSERLRQLQHVPFEALKEDSRVTALLQSMTPPQTLAGPSHGGCSLRVNERGHPD